MMYTINNPKIVYYYADPEEHNFTGIVKDNEITAYYENGEFHRIDGPAIISVFGNGCWYYNGKHYGCDNDFTSESWTKKWNLEIFK